MNLILTKGRNNIGVSKHLDVIILTHATLLCCLASC